MPAVALSPKAGAHGELCGLLAIRAAHEAKGEHEQRRKVLVPTSAHGTNPATAAFVGYSVVEDRPDRRRPRRPRRPGRQARPRRRRDHGHQPQHLRPVRARHRRDRRLTHEAGAYFYCDGANFNAIVGRVRPGDLGVDAMHINLHKTFSTPHGGGGPGAGPVVLSEALAPFAPAPWVVARRERLAPGRARGDEAAQAFGRMCAFHGQMGMFVRALAYMLSHGSDGLRQVAEDAVLNANYIKARLSDLMSAGLPRRALHARGAVRRRAGWKGTGVTTLDFAKAMIDEGFHPMTMYFPLVVHGAMLIEPTETESRSASSTASATPCWRWRRPRRPATSSRFTGAPFLAPLRRLDETRAARKPGLRWTAPEGLEPGRRLGSRTREPSTA